MNHLAFAFKFVSPLCVSIVLDLPALGDAKTEEADDTTKATRSVSCSGRLPATSHVPSSHVLGAPLASWSFSSLSLASSSRKRWQCLLRSRRERYSYNFYSYHHAAKSTHKLVIRVVVIPKPSSRLLRCAACGNGVVALQSAPTGGTNLRAPLSEFLLIN